MKIYRQNIANIVPCDGEGEMALTGNHLLTMCERFGARAWAERSTGPVAHYKKTCIMVPVAHPASSKQGISLLIIPALQPACLPHATLQQPLPLLAHF